MPEQEQNLQSSIKRITTTVVASMLVAVVVGVVSLRDRVVEHDRSMAPVNGQEFRDHIIQLSRGYQHAKSQCHAIDQDLEDYKSDNRREISTLANSIVVMRQSIERIEHQMMAARNFKWSEDQQ